MTPLPPLQFQPIFKRAIWGGRRLATHLYKPIGDGDDYAESWEIVDHDQDQSVVSGGKLHGKTLHSLIHDYNESLFGRHAGLRQFPLLFKFLDCNRPLSVQVHPNDAYARKLSPPDNGKTEAWVVLHADPGSRIYAGLKRGFDGQALEREVRRGTTELCLHAFEPRTGDCLFIPAGTVHALGGGLVIAEIQQASDTTFRLFDWNRVGSDGKPRPLHIEQSLEVIDYASGPVAPQSPEPTADSGVERLVRCEKFVLDRCTFDSAQTLGGDDRFHIIAVLDGQLALSVESGELLVARGQTALLPASCGSVHMTPSEPTTLLDMYLP